MSLLTLVVAVLCLLSRLQTGNQAKDELLLVWTGLFVGSAAAFLVAARATQRSSKWRWVARGAALLAGFAAYLLYTRPQTDVFFVEQAALADPGLFRKASTDEEFYEKHRMELPVAGHRIAGGEGMVLAERMYSDGFIPGAQDDEYYWKLTIWLPRGLPGTAGVLDLAAGSVIAVYSRGSPAFMTNHCYGYLESGTIRFARPSLDRIDAEVDARGRLHGRARCSTDELRISRRYRFTRITLGQVTPWLGRGGDPYEEKRRR